MPVTPCHTELVMMSFSYIGGVSYTVCMNQDMSNSIDYVSKAVCSLTQPDSGSVMNTYKIANCLVRYLLRQHDSPIHPSNVFASVCNT